MILLVCDDLGRIKRNSELDVVGVISSLLKAIKIHVIYNIINIYKIDGTYLYPFLSPPVHVARWAHMRRFLSVVCLDFTKIQTG